MEEAEGRRRGSRRRGREGRTGEAGGRRGETERGGKKASRRERGDGLEFYKTCTCTSIAGSQIQFEVAQCLFSVSTYMYMMKKA